MALRSIRRPLALCLFPWLLALLGGLLGVGTADREGIRAELVRSGPLPTAGCDVDPNGCT